MKNNEEQIMQEELKPEVNNGLQIQSNAKQLENNTKRNNKKQSAEVNKKISEFKEVLTKSINDCNAVYLVGHKNIDFDAIASLGAMALICKKLKKAPYIVIDQEEIDDLNNNEKKFFEHEMLERIKENFVVINLSDYENNRQDNALLIMLDVNQGFRTPFKNHYQEFKKILVLDHHNQTQDTIKVNNKLILSDSVSSTSEIMYWLLKQYKMSVKDIDYYNFLLLGIYLDTNTKRKNTYSNTLDCISELIDKKGVDENKVKEYLSVDFETDRKIQRLVDETKWITIRYAIGIGNETYTDEEIAKAADYALKYTCEAAIFAGKDKNGNYLVKARSNRGNLDIGKLMYDLNKGGGNKSSAAARPMFIDASTPEEEREKLFREIKDVIYHKRQQPRKRYYIKSKNIKKDN